MSIVRRETVLLTGASGFLGKLIKANLVAKGHFVSTLGTSAENDIRCDLAAAVPKLVEPYTWIIHNAGKAHIVPKNVRQKEEFFSINCEGTRNLLAGIVNSGVPPKSVVFISSTSVYGITEGENIPEEQRLSANDPYGASKMEAEKILLRWAGPHSIRTGIVRLPLLVGKNPPGNLGRMIHAIQKGFYLRIGGSKARKSMVLAEDVADFLPTIAMKGGIYNLTDGYHPSFLEIEDIIVKHTGAKKPLNIPYSIGRFLGFLGDGIDFLWPNKSPITSHKIKKIVSTLTFDDQKARQELGWNPRRVIDEFVL